MSMHAQRGPLSTIPQSPGTTLTETPALETVTRDYFSLRRKEPSPSREGDKDKEMLKQPPTLGGSLPSSQTPGGGSFMGKLKGLGKKKTAETTMSPVVEAEPIAENIVSIRLAHIFLHLADGRSTGPQAV
jgi:WD repeat-containing protein 48